MTGASVFSQRRLRSSRLNALSTWVGVEARHGLTAHQHGVIAHKLPLLQHGQVQEGDVAEALRVLVSGGPLECLKVRFGIHHLHVVLPFRLVQNGQADGALEGPRQLAIKLPLHGVHEQGDVIGAAGRAGRLQVQPEAQLVPRPARIEAGAVENDGLPGLLATQVGGETLHPPHIDALALLGLQLAHRPLHGAQLAPHLGQLARLRVVVDGQLAQLLVLQHQAALQELHRLAHILQLLCTLARIPSPGGASLFWGGLQP